MSAPPASSKASGFNLATLIGVSLTTFVVGGFIGSNFFPSATPAPPAPQAAGLPAGHPSIDPSAGVQKAPPLTPDQMSGATSSTSPAAPNEDTSNGFDPTFDDPAIRAQIDTASDYQSLVKIGNGQFDARHPKLAILAYEKALKIHPFDPDVQTDLGVMYRAVHRHDDAVNAFRKAAQIDPKHTQSRYNLGLVLLEDEKDTPAAIRAWEDYLKVDPSGPKSQEVRDMLAELKKSR
jgi:tetratricopeptide (TPR) repeat protein